MASRERRVRSSRVPADDGVHAFYLSLIVLVPLSTLPIRTAIADLGGLLGDRSTDPRVVASYRLSLGAALAAASVNAVFGAHRRLGARALRVSRAGGSSTR